MVILEDYVVPMTVLDDNVEESEASIGVRASKLAGSEVKHEEHRFVVGDLVWCKVRRYVPWFPAQVYDPKDASDFALRHRLEEGMLLVAFFGDGACSWCSPSQNADQYPQLLPFLDNFVQMSGKCDSNKFRNAVQKAVDEYSRMVSDVVCKCVPDSQTGGLPRPVAGNGGVKEGVLVPEVDVNRILVPKFEAFDVLAEVCHFAKTVSVGNKLHLATLKGRLSAFYRSKGYQLPLYSEPKLIEGLEEKEQVTVELESKGRLSVTMPRKRKAESLESGKENVWQVQLIPRKPDETVNTKQVLDNVSSPRAKKMSRYLCPPYISPFSRKGNSKHGSNYKTYQKFLTGPKKNKKSLPVQPKLATEIGTSSDTDGLISDAQYVTREFGIMTYILEKCHTALSVEEKASLKEDIKQIGESVERVMKAARRR